MRVVVCVPWRAGEPHRERAWLYVRDWWADLDYPVFTSPGPDWLMNRSAARNQAASLAGDWDVAIFADADTIARPGNLGPTVKAAASGMLAYPFDGFEGLNQIQTEILYQGGDPGRGRFRKKHPSPGGILAVGRDLWEQVGGYDEAFEGWGYEDLAFRYAAGTLGGVHRQPGKITHLWHPHAVEKRDAIAMRTPNRARKDRYAQANGKPKAMRILLEELR